MNDDSDATAARDEWPMFKTDVSPSPIHGTRRAAIARYYDYTTPFYKLFWHGDSAALHYGFKDAWTRTALDELHNTNRFLARIAGIDANDSVLDAGCGVGGSAVWIASHLGATVQGLTLSHRQARLARERGKRYSVEDRVKFEIGDYENTQLPDNSFDVVWAIESVCYATNKRRFLQEAFRLLKPGGRLVVADGFLRREPMPGRETQAYHRFLCGVVLPNLARVSRFMDAMKDIGYTRVREWDKTVAATPSSRRLYRRCAVGYPIAIAGQALGLTPALLTANIRAGIAQRTLVRSGVATYSVVYGEKPCSTGASSPRTHNT